MTNRELLARLIKCEAGGEGEDGMKAVATTVMNRVRAPYGEYQRVGQGDVRRVIEQLCQFVCHKPVVEGRSNTQNVWVATPEPVHFRIADWALNGGVHLGTGRQALWFMNPFSANCPRLFPYNGVGYWYTRVNQHCFFNPTDAYRNT